MVSVGDCGHGVDLEELVRTDGGSMLDGSPVGEGRLSIVEPLIAQVLEVVGVVVGNARGDLRTGHSAAEREHLLANLVVDLVGGLELHQGVVKGVAATDNLDIVHVVGVDSGQADTAVVHLASEHFVTEEVVAEKAGVAVGVVLGVTHGNVDEVTEQGVHGVVLLLDVVEVLGVLVNSVRTENVLEQQETVVVGVLDAGSIVEHADVAVVHLVVTDEQHAGRVDVLLTVGSGSGGSLADGVESTLHLLDELVVVDVASGDDDNVVTEPVGGTVVLEIINSQLANDVAVTLNRLAHHVLTIGVEVSVFNGGFLEVGGVHGVFLDQVLLAELKFSGVKGSVGDGVTKHVDNLVDIVLEASHGDVGGFTAGFRVDAGAHGLDLLSQGGLGAGGGAAQHHLLESIGGTRGGKGILARASAEVDTNSGSHNASLFSADTDAIGEGSDLEGTVELEGLGDFTSGQVAEVGDDGGLRELEVVFGLDDLVVFDGLSFDKIIGGGRLVFAAAEAPSSSGDGCWLACHGSPSDKIGRAHV